MGAVLSPYMQALTRAMAVLAEDQHTVFVGQAVRYDGQAAFETFRDVPTSKKIEMPVCEDFQMGFCTGLALQGYKPISFYPRFDFLLLAVNQLVNHLDKLPLMGGFTPQVIIRTAVGRDHPLDPGPQHVGSYAAPFQMMLKSVRVWTLDRAADIVDAYQEALKAAGPTILVEYMRQY